MVRMSAKKQNSLTEMVRDAATGYATVVLSVVGFLLALVVVVAGVRIVAGSSLSPNAAGVQNAAITATNGNETA